MKFFRLMMVFAIAANYSLNARAAIVCIQNKTTGEYESRMLNKTGVNECNAFDIAALINDIETVPARSKQPFIKLQKPAALEPLQPVMEEWRVRKDDKTIRAVLERWGALAGWHIAWEVPRKVPIAFDATFTGSFELAVDKLMRSLRGSDYPLINCQYENNKVVRILRRGEIKKCEE